MTQILKGDYTDFLADYADEERVDRLRVEIKSLAGNIPIIFEHQLISYLKASGLHVGLLINFGNKSCQVKRVVF
jgi:GxxExxY protein